MPANVIQANYEQLEQIARQFIERATNTEEVLRYVVSQMEDLQSDGWWGAGADAFYAEMEDDVLPGVRRLKGALNQAGDTTRRIIEIMMDAEEQAGNMFSQTGESPDYGKKKIGDYVFTGTETFSGSLFNVGAGDGIDIHPSDAQQGALGDCYLVSSLASVAMQNPDIIRNAIQDNGDGTYTVTFYKEKKNWLNRGTGEFEAVEVTVTAEFPVGETTINGTTYSSGLHISPSDLDGSGNPELWSMIMERAYAEFKGGDRDIVGDYREIIGGWSHDALEHLTGVPSTSHGDTQHYSMSELETMFNNGQSITFSSKQGGFLTWGFSGPNDYYANDILVESHAYYVSGIDTSRNIVTVRNPWSWSHPEIEIPFDDLDDAFRKITVNPLQ